MIPLPTHPEIHTYRWTALELRAIEQWGREVEAASRRQALEEAARVCDGVRKSSRPVDSMDRRLAQCARAIRSLIDKDTA